MIEIDGRILVMGNIFFARILEEEHMVSGLKAQRRLAVYVALGLSTGGGTVVLCTIGVCGGVYTGKCHIQWS